jgi:hypothetical protein
MTGRPDNRNCPRCGRPPAPTIERLCLVLGLVLLSLSARAAGADTAPSVTIQVAGAPEPVFDWQHDRCEKIDTPDAPPRAFRDAEGKVHLFASHYVLREQVGPSLDQVRHDCRIVHQSAMDDSFDDFQDHQWIASTYTPDGRTVYALVHDEFQGNLRPSLCPSRNYLRCWSNVLTLLISRDQGRSFTQPLPRGNLVAMPPYRYAGDVGSPVGYFQPSNIVRKGDFYYTLFRATAYMDQRNGTCLMRTDRLDDPSSWRGWDGQGFSITFLNPYKAVTHDPRNHVCMPLKAKLLTMGGMARDPSSGAFTLVMKGALPSASGQRVLGIWAAASYDLIHWSEPVLVWPDPSGATREGEAGAVDRDPSLLDPTSDSRNFDTIGSRPYIYFVRDDPSNRPYSRRLLRVPVRIGITQR